MPSDGPAWKTNPRCNPDQLAMLKRCSDKKDVAEWNEWRKKSPRVEVWLQGANLTGAHLEGAKLWRAHLEGASFVCANLEDATLLEAHLEEANLMLANLAGADLTHSRLERARLMGTQLEGSQFFQAHLEGADFRSAHVNARTTFVGIHFDRNTRFQYVALDQCRIGVGVLQSLQYTERKANWKEWYASNRLLEWPIRLFWSMSDYGRSGKRVAFCFAFLAVVFGFVYVLWPDIVEGLIPKSGELTRSMLLLRSMYFSVVTMTTLGFGDIYAHPQSAWGHLLLMLQVILGYVLLGALVTRFAVMFTAGGPAAEFPEDICRRQRWKRKLLSPRRWKRRALRLAATANRLRRIREGRQLRWPWCLPKGVSKLLRRWSKRG